MKAVDPTIQIGIDFASPGATDPISLAFDPDLAASVCKNTAIDLAIIHYYPGTYNAVQPSELLSLPQSDLPTQLAFIKKNLAANCANASAVKFWLTETSPNGNLAPGFPSVVTGLFSLNEYMTALQLGIQNIDWLELHNTTFLDSSENPGPSFYGIQLAHLIAAVGNQVVSATSSSSTVLSFATLNSTTGQKGILLLNANPSVAAVVQVTVTGSTVGTTATQYAYGATTTQTSATLPSTSVPIAGNTFSVTVPPYTAIDLLIP